MIKRQDGLVSPLLNRLFFSSTTLLALIGLPIYAWNFDFKTADWVIFVFWAGATMMATTMGHHRLFAHKAFKAHPVIVFLNLFFGAAAFEGSALNWSSEHRNHHRYTDTPKDPYDITQGFWHAHMGWFLKPRYQSDYQNVKDLSSNPMILNQHNFWPVWAIGAGIALPLLLGFVFGSFWGTFFLGVSGRFFVIHQSVFLINSACHMFGKPTYDLKGSANDSWLCAFLTHGEGYHSYHHRFPSDFRNGVKWHHWDPTKWFVKFLSFFGLTYDLIQISEVRILEARCEAEQKGILESLSQKKIKVFADATKHVNSFYETFEDRMKDWEVNALEYKKMTQELTRDFPEKLKSQKACVQEARHACIQMQKQWLLILERYTQLVQPTEPSF